MGIPPHRIAVLRSLALHRAVVDRIEARPELLELARQRVVAWERSGAVSELYVEAWKRVLSLPLPELRRAVCEDTDAGHDRRQVSPFAGMLPPRERWAVLRECRAHER